MRNFLPQCFGFANSKHTDSYAEQEPSAPIAELCSRFSVPQLREATNNFDESQIIHRGYSGPVYKGCILVNGEAKEVAIKRYGKPDGSKYVIDKLKNEIVLLCQLRHQNLVSLIGFCDDKNEFIMVYEYLSNGDLGAQIDGADKHISPLSWKKRLEICIGVARGLHYLHAGLKYTIIHRDVKPSNILLDENWVPKIADFGLSLRGPIFSSKYPKPKEVDKIVGTYGYMAPEYIMHGSVTEKIDVFSFGTGLLEVLCAKKVYTITEQIYKRVDLNEQIYEDVDLSDYDSQDEGKSESSIFPSNPISYLVHKKKVDEFIDPFLKGKIAPKCLELFMSIAERCTRDEATERPHMGEVEMELELALQLQEQADANLPCDSQHSNVNNTASSSQSLEAHS